MFFLNRPTHGPNPQLRQAETWIANRILNQARKQVNLFLLLRSRLQQRLKMHFDQLLQHQQNLRALTLIANSGNPNLNPTKAPMLISPKVPALTVVPIAG